MPLEPPPRPQLPQSQFQWPPSQSLPLPLPQWLRQPLTQLQQLTQLLQPPRQRQWPPSPPQPRGWRLIKQIFDKGSCSDGNSSVTIEQVSHNWREVHNNAFDPKMIRIGFFKFRDGDMSRLQTMEEHKKRFLTRLLRGNLERRRSDGDMSSVRVPDDCERVEHEMEAARFEELVEDMRRLEKKARDCYPKGPVINSDEFRQMMVVDGCFVVELLRLYYNLLHTESTGLAIEDDPIFTNLWILTTLRRDLLLLENQLPFFVLEELYKLINDSNNIDHQQAVPLEVLVVTFFDPLFPGQNAASKLDTKKPKASPVAGQGSPSPDLVRVERRWAHLLEVFHSTFLRSESEKVPMKGKIRAKPQSKHYGSIIGLDLHFASELEEAGVQFKKRKGHDLLDIEFGHGTLRVPPLSINDRTISPLLNFVAYELRVDHPVPIFTNYLMFWNSLVNSPGDIQILHKHGIVNNTLGSNEVVANLLIRCREVIYDHGLGYFYNEIKEVNGYCERYYESKRRVWWRSLIRERFSSPWTCLSLLAAIILLLLTALQAIYTVYPYYRPH